MEGYGPRFCNRSRIYLSIVLMAGLREKIDINDIPKPFRGMPIVLSDRRFDVHCVLRIFRNDLRRSFMITGILIAAALVGGTGLVIGLLLGVAERNLQWKLMKKRSPSENSFRAITAVAVDIGMRWTGQLQSLAGKAPVNGCPVGGNRSGKSHRSHYGEEITEGRRMTAFVNVRVTVKVPETIMCMTAWKTRGHAHLSGWRRDKMSPWMSRLRNLRKGM